MSQIPLPFGSKLAFYLSVEGPCPYLEGMGERKIFTRQKGDVESDRDMGANLTRAGFRRSHDVWYRQACANCDACVPVRLVLGSFAPSRSQRRLEKRNVDLVPSIVPSKATPELFELFQHYIWARHGHSDMAHMDEQDFARMLEMGAGDAWLFQLRTAGEGKLLGCAIVDEVGDGFSAVYSFFDPREDRRSLGTTLILALAYEAQRRDKPYLYLGYWIKACDKMAYKTQFKPLEHLTPRGWKRF